MKLKITFFSIAIILNQAVFSQKYKIEKTPEWVKEINIPAKSLFAKYDISLGYYLSLSDCQVNLENNSYFNREVRNVVSYSGITKASQLLVTYDTAYQQLKIHHLYIWRKGEKIDRTSELNFKILNNEYNLHQGIYMGRITAYVNLDDIRKDDQIDFSFTIVGANPIFGVEKYIFATLETTNPIDLLSLRVLYSKGKDYNYKCVNSDSTIKISDTIVGNLKQIEIIEENVKAFKFEDNMPGWAMPYKYFTLTSFNSWKDVNIWAQSVFALKKEPNFESVFKELFSGSETTDEKIDKIIHFVQNEIRYMGIESGIGSIKPFPPEQVVKQRFGDCKDKSLLLVSLLKKVGIAEAYPALVNTFMQEFTSNLSISNQVFNHCIVTFVYNNKTYWVDPTLEQQGGNFRNMSVFDYGQALVIGIPSDSLTKMAIQDSSSSINIKDEFYITSFTEPAKYEILSIRHGMEADRRRMILEQHSAEDLSKYVTDDLKKCYPIVNRVDDIVINDDLKNNEFSVRYKYELDGFWQDGDKQSDKRFAGYWIFKFEPQTLYQDLNVSPCETRKTDYAIMYPLNLSYKVILHFPKDMLIYDKYTKYDNEAFFFDEKIEQISANSFQVSYNYKTKAKTIKAENYKKICEEKNSIAKNLPILIYFNK